MAAPSHSTSLPRAGIALSIELGRTQIYWDDALRLCAGSVVPLDTKIADPVDVMAGGRLVAHGEVVIVDGKLCIRVTELISGVDRLANEAA
jgi:flagellar motor switch protein FliN